MGGAARRSSARATQHKFARFEGLRQIIVCAVFQPRDAIFRFAACREHQDWDLRLRPHTLRQVQSAFARHHHVHDHQIEGDAFHQRACILRTGRCRNPKAILGQIFLQQGTEPLVVVHDEYMAFLHAVHGFAPEIRGPEARDEQSCAVEKRDMRWRHGKRLASPVRGDVGSPSGAAVNAANPWMWFIKSISGKPTKSAPRALRGRHG